MSEVGVVGQQLAGRIVKGEGADFRVVVRGKGAKNCDAKPSSTAGPEQGQSKNVKKIGMHRDVLGSTYKY